MTQEKRRDPREIDVEREKTWESEGGRRVRPDDDDQDPSTQRMPHPDPDTRTQNPQNPMKKK